MKSNPYSKEKKSLSFSRLLMSTRKIFDEIAIPKHNKINKKRKIKVSDCLMSALAMFGLKSPSLLAFDLDRNRTNISHNLKTLYKIENAPSDTYMREILDEINPKECRETFLKVFHEAQRSKLLERYEFINGNYLCLVDGTEIFNSEKVHCKNCCEKHHKDGRTTYHHQILGAVIAHPKQRQVLSLCPEPITKQDGAKKNDCERNAFKRFLKDLKKEHPRLKLTMVSDALSANAPHINELTLLGYNYIISVKPEGNKFLFEFAKGITREVKITVGKNQYKFCYINDIPLNDTKEAPNVNFIRCEAIEVKGNKVKKRTFSWVTNHKITDDNVHQLMCGGRARWKVENETFNTLKNQGYQFQHNFGHGKKNLHTVFAFLMMLAFLIDQIQEATCGLFKAALKEGVTRRSLWERLRSFFYLYLIDTWENLLKALGCDFTGVALPNTS